MWIYCRKSEEGYGEDGEVGSDDFFYLGLGYCVFVFYCCYGDLEFRK